MERKLLENLSVDCRVQLWRGNSWKTSQQTVECSYGEETLGNLLVDCRVQLWRGNSWKTSQQTVDCSYGEEKLGKTSLFEAGNSTMLVLVDTLILNVTVWRAWR